MFDVYDLLFSVAKYPKHILRTPLTGEKTLFTHLYFSSWNYWQTRKKLCCYKKHAFLLFILFGEQQNGACWYSFSEHKDCKTSLKQSNHCVGKSEASASIGDKSHCLILDLTCGLSPLQFDVQPSDNPEKESEEAKRIRFRSGRDSGKTFVVGKGG